MNASDIVTKKNNQTLYQAYYHPTSSTINSTIYTVSSISGGTTSYGSTMQTILNYTCPPTFYTYADRSASKNGQSLYKQCPGTSSC
jgi:hypothetical protein